MRLTFNQICLLISVLIALLFLIFPSECVHFLNNVIGELLETFDQVFLWIVSVILMICLGLIFSPYGKVKLGGQAPEFSTFSWIAMLFAAGMGSGLIFWGVAEPVFHLTSPLNTENTMLRALSITNFHWGLHAWAIYAFSGLIIAWYSYTQGREMTISATLSTSPNSWLRMVDLLGVMSILFGVAGTLANSIALIQTGIEHIIPDISLGILFRIVLLLLMAIVFTASSLSGLKKGVKLLSNFNVFLALLLLLFVFVNLDVLTLLELFFKEIVDYLTALPVLSFIIEEENAKWSQSWSIIYFLWWIAWAPFTGLFIARISKGRTVREFLISVILFPTLITIFWFVVFGGGASLVEQYPIIQNAVADNYTEGVFTFFKAMPMTILLSILAITLLITFVITSADSAIFVTVLLTGNDSSVNKLIWSLVMVGISIALIYENNVDLNKVIAITGAIPFVIIILFQGILFIKNLIQKNKIFPIKNDDHH